MKGLGILLFAYSLLVSEIALQFINFTPDSKMIIKKQYRFTSKDVNSQRQTLLNFDNVVV